MQTCRSAFYDPLFTFLNKKKFFCSISLSHIYFLLYSFSFCFSLANLKTTRNKKKLLTSLYASGTNTYWFGYVYLNVQYMWEYECIRIRMRSIRNFLFFGYCCNETIEMPLSEEKGKVKTTIVITILHCMCIACTSEQLLFTLCFWGW